MSKQELIQIALEAVESAKEESKLIKYVSSERGAYFVSKYRFDLNDLSTIESALRAQQERENPQPLERAFALACRILADNAMLCPQEVFETEWEECDGEADKCGDVDMWKCWQRFINETVEAERVCRVCGCTEMNACVDGHDSCCWVEDDLCSACVTEPKGEHHD